MIKNQLIVTSFLLLSISAFWGCKKTYNTIYQDTQTDTGVLVTNGLSTTIPFNQIQTFTKGTKMKIRLNRIGYDVREYDVTFLSATTDGGEQLIYCSIPGVVIGAGDSGSPLLTADGRVAGALCYGWDGDNHQFAARAIEDLLSISNKTKSGVATNNSLQSNLFTIAPSYQCNGLNSEYIKRFASRDKFNILSRYAVANTTNMVTLSKLKSTGPTSLIPGMSATVIEAIGDLILLGATGTVSYINGSNIFAFGHHFSDAYMPSAAPVCVANTKIFVESNTNSYKYSDITSYQIGSLTVDDQYGVLFNNAVTEQMYKTRLAIKFYGNDSLIYNNYLTNNTNINYEYSLSAQIPSLAIYKNRDLLIGKYVKVTGTVISKAGLVTETDNISFNTLTSNVDLDLNDVLTDKFSKYDRHITSQAISLSITSSTYADSILVPVVKK